jgi:uncharacterized protein (TIGR03790 family)
MRLFLRALILWAAVLLPLAGQDLAERVVILANESDPESLELARYYAEKRGIPQANIIALNLPRQETISWREFIESIFNPLQARLVQDGWIDALPTQLKDEHGRAKFIISGHRMSFLVATRGVPLRIAHDPTRLGEALAERFPAPFRTNQASVDSELALLPRTGGEINAFIPNPLFQRPRPALLEEGTVLRVSRLDGPTLADCFAMIDGALAAERDGLLGRAYVDVGGPHPEGDRWLEETAAQLEQMGFEVTTETTRGLFGLTDRMDAPAAYFGWYASSLTGPFLNEGFQFPPGAIALHIHSFSATTLRSANTGWCGPLIARRVAATVGNVYEPYLQFSHQPHLLVQALREGKTFGEAAFFSLPALSWQAIALGDPLYRPFAVPLSEQWELLDNRPHRLKQYAVLRRVAALEQAGQLREARRLLAEAAREQPGMAIALREAKARVAEGRPEAASEALQIFSFVGRFRGDELALAFEAAQLLRQRGGAPEEAMRIIEALLEGHALAREWRLKLYEEGIPAAEAAGRLDQQVAWRTALQRLRDEIAAEQAKAKS